MEIADLKFACFDTETTGLSPQTGGKICEIAVCVSRGGKVFEEFSTLVNPQCPIHPDVVAIHGITSEMASKAPTFKEILPRLEQLFEGCILVAHNADFDISFLKSEFEQAGKVYPDYPVLDTLKMARKSRLFAKNNLGLIAGQIGICADGWHRAMADTKMLEQILYYLLKHLEDNGVHTWEKLQSSQFVSWKDLAVTH